jgi:hypothetical protein
MKGEPAIVAEHVLATDGRVVVGVRTADGRNLRATFREAFIVAS